ncbi:hypothetical protein HPT25_14515 [Bacillus sp. BRMEA1]|uniref:hypothetical protein n=1 Tax=Neobacillus endophyticus TaxID=2738405 RepID=UPI0015661AB4|nr:hypothetical protein [Neobacillus endophyticus]NRD78574.1 hypothetical protein [Neobacillus endophyticus]
MKNIPLFMITTITFLMVSSFSAYAETTKNLPITKTSDHWKVTLGNPDSDSLKPQKDVFNVYSLDIKNIGEKVFDPVFEVYRDEPNSHTLYWLTSNIYIDYSKKTASSGNMASSENMGSTLASFHHKNLPVYSKAKIIEVVITWKEKPYEQMKNGKKFEARKFKQTFIFKQD